MIPLRIWKRLLLCISLICLLLVGAVVQWAWSPMDQDTITLRTPPFLSVVHAQGDSFADDEAGIAAYFNAGRNIDLTQVGAALRYTEIQTDQYIIGALQLTDYTNEAWDVKLYAAADGWVMAYYDKSVETSKIFDWVHYDGGPQMPTLLEQALKQIALAITVPEPAPTYYHFAFPNADRMMLISDFCTRINCADEFQITLPAEFEYHEMSWSLAGSNGSFSDDRVQLFVDGAQLEELDPPGGSWFISSAILNPMLTLDQQHTIRVSSTGSFSSSDVRADGGLAILYKGS
ncbi:MAG: hypothetical protein AAF702_49835 [Chloroflexota bacterium]